MRIQGKVGRQLLSDGSEADIRLSRNGSMVITNGHAKSESAVLEGDVYIGANLGGTPVTTQAGLSTTTPALTLYNPVGSGVNLILYTVTVDITSSPAAASGLMLAYNTSGTTPPATTTTATVTNALLGTSKQPIGQCYRIATLGAAPTAIRFIGGTTGASAIGGVQLIDEIDGSIVIGPGVALSIQSTTAAAILASFTWRESPL